jgi:hypothetical protein
MLFFDRLKQQLGVLGLSPLPAEIWTNRTRAFVKSQSTERWRNIHLMHDCTTVDQSKSSIIWIDQSKCSIICYKETFTSCTTAPLWLNAKKTKLWI